MGSLAHFDSLSDEVLAQILWPAKQLSACKSDNDILWATEFIRPMHFKGTPLVKDAVDDTVYNPLATPPASTDAAYNLLVASVCSRWRRLAKRHVSTLLVREDRVVASENLKAAIKCFPNLTHLHLSNGSLDILDNTLLVHLASLCPGLRILNLGRRLIPSSDVYQRDRHPVTEAGLGYFFKHCSQLEQLSLYCLHGDVRLPPSFFLLKRLRSLALADVKFLEHLQKKNLPSLAALDLQHAAWSTDLHHLPRLVHLTSLTSLTIPGDSPDGPSFSFKQLRSLESLNVTLDVLSNRLLPVGSTCCLKRLEVFRGSETERLPVDLGKLLPSLEELSITHEGRSELPDFTSLRRLQSLTICTRDLSTLPESLGELQSLKTLVLRHVSALTNLPGSFCQLKSLETLFVIECKIRELPAGFSSLTSLKSMCFMDAPELILPEDLGELTGLHTFVLNGNHRQPHILPPSFSQLTSLTRLELNDCVTTSLPPQMGELRSLQELYIHSCSNIKEIPESLTTLVSLEIITIGNCISLCSIPRRLDSLTRLKQLELTGCEQLTDAPECLPASLEVLSLGNRQKVTSLPAFPALPKLKRLSFGIIYALDRMAIARSLPSLEHLELSLAQRSAELPFPVISLSSLRTLKIFGAGRMKSLPNPVFYMSRLKELVIGSAAELVTLPPALTKLQQLTALAVHAPKLTSLPADIGAMSRLTSIRLGGCSALKTLPASITSLSSLRYLSLFSTAIRFLPPNVARLTRLQSLDLEDCMQLEALPGSLTELKLLEYLKIEGCEGLLDDCGDPRFPGADMMDPGVLLR